jgi:hypothetical protein
MRAAERGLVRPRLAALLLALGCSLGFAVRVFPEVEDLYGFEHVDPLAKLSAELRVHPCDETTLLRYTDVLESHVDAGAAATVIYAAALHCRLGRPALERAVRLHTKIGAWDRAMTLTDKLADTHGRPNARDLLWLLAAAKDRDGDFQSAAQDYHDAADLDIRHGNGALFRGILDRRELGERVIDRYSLISSTPVSGFAAQLGVTATESVRRARTLAAALK